MDIMIKNLIQMRMEILILEIIRTVCFLSMLGMMIYFYIKGMRCRKK